MVELSIDGCPWQVFFPMKTFKLSGVVNLRNFVLDGCTASVRDHYEKFRMASGSMRR